MTDDYSNRDIYALIQSATTAEERARWGVSADRGLLLNIIRVIDGLRVATQVSPPTHPLSEGDTTELGPLDRIRFLALVGDNTPSTMSKALRQIYQIACEVSPPTPEAALAECSCGHHRDRHVITEPCSQCICENFESLSSPPPEPGAVNDHD